MTTSIKITAKTLKTLGFEIADAEDFLAEVDELANAGDREGLINRIAGGASVAEATKAADEILAAVRR